MAGLRFETPVNWLDVDKCTTPGVIEELKRRCTLEELEVYMTELKEVHTLLKKDHWFDEIFYVRILRWCLYRDEESFDILGRILCQAMEVPRDCVRKLKRGHQHNLTFFTNYRAIQVYCCHEDSEATEVRNLVRGSIHFYLQQEDNKIDGKTYHEYTQLLFYKARPFLAWDCIFPDGIDMEALSPRDTNAHIRAKQQAAMKSKAAPVKLGKEKDHPPPPPPEVREPPSSDREDGAIYRTGRLLGKGGFAICYEAVLVQPKTNQVYALKIVKSHMPQKKMEQKFQTELQIHSKMKHANIVQFHRAFSFDKCTYIVLELCPNGSLMDMVKKRRYITEPEVRYWTVQMAGAIKYMHAKGIIHRDLKMGNIFLDRNMNVKIGDFGLAALLMSGKDWQACRRTTLCGTPNYIAPEILSKDKGGHDHAVDIWSLGIIIFAMLTGKPPFQSATADEIYRRARERDYDWPKLDTSENFISEETKDLVAGMLQAPEKRPDPDAIVQHAFFTCGYVPQAEEITPSLRERHPDPNVFLSVGVRGTKSASIARNLKKLCITCDVGPWTESKRHTSTYREVADEEKAGLTPKVPLPEDVVYRPFHEWLHEQANEVMGGGEGAKKAVKALDKVLSLAPKAKANEQPGGTRPSTQSFAAQQRARPEASTAKLIKSSREQLIPRQGGFSIPNTSQKVEAKKTEEVADVEDRLAADMLKQLASAEVQTKAQQPEEPTISLKLSSSLFSPKESLEKIPNTTPDIVFGRLRGLQVELDRALNSRTIAIEVKAPPPAPTIVVKWVDYTNKYGLGYILSNGSVGCIFKAIPSFADEPAKGFNPPTCLVVRDGENHLINVNNKSYVDYRQLLPISGANIEFYENRGDSGVFRGTVSPANFKSKNGPRGEILKLAPGKDEWDERKRARLYYWKKFSQYMIENGRDSDFPYDDVLNRNLENQSPAVAAGNVVTFYQRFGDVGCWGFCDGHFQFNFPDHTKIVISADGTWCDFYHLPLEAARDLATNGTIPSAALDDRQHLSYPLQTLLNFMAKPSRSAKTTGRKRPEISPMIQGIPQANDFRRKVEFIRSIVKEWVTNGGIGISDMSTEGRLRWNGHREQINVRGSYKAVWATVGGRGGDDRKVAWFNPREPDEIVPDIER